MAAPATTATSGAITPLEPNAPPTSGTMTRMLSSGRPSTWLSWLSGRWVSWAEHHTVSRSRPGSYSAIAPRGSIGTAARRGSP